MTAEPRTGSRPAAPPQLPRATAAPGGATLGAAALAGTVVLCGITLLLGYLNKRRCTGPAFGPDGRSEPDYLVRRNRDVCYSDVQELWVPRRLGEHAFPYLTGGITPDGRLTGAVVEYPVLSGLVMWLGGLAADTDAEFLLGSALLLSLFGLVTAWQLGRLAGRRALLWALGPPLVLYAFHNWDLPVVACSVAAVWAVHAWRTDRPLVHRAVAAAVLLGLGFAFKIYPAAFVAPLALYVLTGGAGGRAGRDVRGALLVCGAAAGTAVLVNLPFAVLGYEGWRASFAFQQQRRVDVTTNSIWFWGVRPFFDDDVAFQETMDWLSPVAVLASFALALAIGWWRYRRGGTYPWIGVSAAMLCGFLLLHKVHSPQYTLWLLPFLVLLWVRWGWIVGYLAVDAAMGIGIFRWYYATTTGLPAGIYDGLAAQAVAVGVWGRAALLVALFWVFLHERSTVPDADADDGAGRPRAPGAVGTGAGADADADADADAVPVPVTRRPAPA